MQGQLRNEHLSIEIDTSCAHCGETLRLSVDSELRWRVLEGGSEPLVFEPDVDWSSFDEANILDAY